MKGAVKDIEIVRFERKHTSLSEEIDRYDDETRSIKTVPVEADNDEVRKHLTAYEPELGARPPELKKRRLLDIAALFIDDSFEPAFIAARNVKPTIDGLTKISRDAQSAKDDLAGMEKQNEIRGDIKSLEKQESEEQQQITSIGKDFTRGFVKSAKKKARKMKPGIRKNRRKLVAVSKKIDHLRRRIGDFKGRLDADPTLFFLYLLGVIALALAVNTGYQLGNIFEIMGRSPFAGYMASLLVLATGFLVGDFYEKQSYPKWMYRLFLSLSGLAVLGSLIVLLINAIGVERVIHDQSTNLFNMPSTSEPTTLFSQVMSWAASPTLIIIIQAFAELFVVSTAHILWDDYKLQANKPRLRKLIADMEGALVDELENQHALKLAIEHQETEKAKLENTTKDSAYIDAEFKKTTEYSSERKKLLTCQEQIKAKKRDLANVGKMSPEKDELYHKFDRLIERVCQIKTRLPDETGLKKLYQSAQKRAADVAKQMASIPSLPPQTGVAL